VILTAHFDEAGTDGSFPFVVVGGLVAPVLKWSDFDRRWRKWMVKNGVHAFHALEFRANDPPYDKWSQEKKRQFTTRCAELIERRTTCGLTIRLENDDYERCYLGPGPVKKLQLDSKYGVCIRVAMSFLPGMLREHLRHDDFKVNLILESGDKSIGAGDAVRVFNQIKEHAPEFGRHFGTIAFGKKRDFPGLQAADGIVAPVHRMERGTPDLTAFPVGGTLADARAATNSRSPIFRFLVNEPILTELRTDIVAWKEARRQWWRNGRGDGAIDLSASEP